MKYVGSIERILNAKWAPFGALILFFLYIFVKAGSYPREAARFPQFISFIGILITTIELYKELKTKRNPNGDKVERKNIEARQFNHVTIVVSVIVYSLFVKYIGFIVSSMIFLVITPVLLGYTKKKIVIVLAIVAPFLLSLVFTSLLKIALPAGIIF